MKKYKCDDCYDTGWYGDNGPGIFGNNEYQRCECRDKLIEENPELEPGYDQMEEALFIIFEVLSHTVSLNGTTLKFLKTKVTQALRIDTVPQKT